MGRPNNIKRVSHFKPGQKLTADWTKDVANALNEDVRRLDSVDITRPLGYAADVHDAYELFEFDTSATNSLHRNNVLSLKVKQPANDSRDLMTFGPRKVLADVPAPLIVLMQSHPYLLKADTTNPPVKGEECGVYNGFILDSRGSGFTALSEPFAQGSISLVWARFNSASLAESYLRLIEDHLPGRPYIWAIRSDRGGTTLAGVTEPAKLWYPQTLLQGARLNYLVQAQRIAGEWEFVQGSGCIPTTCNPATNGSSVEPGTPPQGVVGTAYSHTITTSGLSGAVTATALPPGITLSGTTFSGTPTTAGKYWVVVTGPKTGAGCNVTRIVHIEVVEP